LIEKVRVKNRHDCCGGRIAGTKVTISGQFCATLPSAGNGAWIDVKCEKPLMGTEIRLTTTRRDYLQINAVEPYGWSMGGGIPTGGKIPTGGSYNIPPNTKCGIN